MEKTYSVIYWDCKKTTVDIGQVIIGPIISKVYDDLINHLFEHIDILITWETNSDKNIRAIAILNSFFESGIDVTGIENVDNTSFEEKHEFIRCLNSQQKKIFVQYYFTNANTDKNQAGFIINEAPRHSLTELLKEADALEINNVITNDFELIYAGKNNNDYTLCSRHGIVTYKISFYELQSAIYRKENNCWNINLYDHNGTILITIRTFQLSST